LGALIDDELNGSGTVFASSLVLRYRNLDPSRQQEDLGLKRPDVEMISLFSKRFESSQSRFGRYIGVKQ